MRSRETAALLGGQVQARWRLVRAWVLLSCSPFSRCLSRSVAVDVFCLCRAVSCVAVLRGQKGLLTTHCWVPECTATGLIPACNALDSERSAHALRPHSDPPLTWASRAALLTRIASTTMADAAPAPAPSAAPAPAAPLSPARTKAYLRSQALAAKASEPRSWAESVQRYSAARTQPSHPSVMSPPRPSKTGVFNLTASPAVFNPVAQRFTSPDRERATAEAELAAADQARRDSAHRRDHQANHKGYNILSGVREPTSNAAVAAALTAQDQAHPTKVRIDPATGHRIISFHYPPAHPPAREYNIVTNHECFVDSAEKLAEMDARGRVLPRHNKHDLERREYNILNNRYQQPPGPAGNSAAGGADSGAAVPETHEDRFAREQRALEQSLRAKYFATRHYDPISLRFVHPAEESRYQEEKSVAQATHGQMQLRSYPPSIKRSEGLLYDILAPNIIKDQEQLSVYYLSRERAARAAHQKSFEMNRSVAARDVAAEDRAATKSANRVSTRRYEEQINRGHDIVTNEAYEGRNHKQLHEPKQGMVQMQATKGNA